MARVTVEDCLKNVDSRFTLVHLAVRRVLQLRNAAAPTIENAKNNKEVVLALREIAAKEITIDNIREIEESRPIPVEPPKAESGSAAVDLKEIMEEATTFPALDFDEPEQLTEQELDQDSDSESDMDLDREDI